MGDTSLGRLNRALERFPRDRYPVKHASVQRAIAHERALEGSSKEAETALRIAIEVYEDRLPTERAETLNSLGAVLRDQGRLAEAAEVFQESISMLEDLGHGAELGVSEYNLGLVRLEQGDRRAAIECFHSAASRLDASSHPAELGAALRELGAALLLEGAADEAIVWAERSADLAAEGGDRAGLGSSANVIGLARLALDEPAAAVVAFTESASAHALTVRAEGHAMAKANLALAYEALSETDRARQAARHAASIPGIPEVVAEQVHGTLERLGADYDLHLILDSAQASSWPGILRDEVRHWARSAPEELIEAAESWVDGMTLRRASAVDRAEALFDALLEMESSDFGEIALRLGAAIEAREGESGGVRGEMARAAARFRVPQMHRLETALGFGDAR